MQGSPMGENSPGTVKVQTPVPTGDSSAHGQVLENDLALLTTSDNQAIVGLVTSAREC